MRAYASAVESVVEKPGKPLCPKPVFRASAIFPALNRKGVSTRICFLGYWMVKRSIPEVSAVITLRSESGKVLTRATRSIRECRAYCFELADQLMAAGIPADTEFVGSIEVEFFSARDLVFPYPAVIVNYYGPTFSTFVHTAQRIFNDVEEARDVMTTSVPESGFNIYSDDDLDPFFAFVNGFESVPDCRIMMEFHNYEGEVLQRELRPGDLGAYQTVMVHLKEVVDLHSFLKGRVGTAKIRYDAKWVYPRMVAGNWQRSLGALSITHTYYDCTEAKTAADYWMPAEAGWHPMSTAIPASISEDRFTNIYFYPIQSPSVVEIDLEVYTANGKLLGKVPAAQRIESPSTGLHQISLKPICQQFGNCDGRDLAVKVIARAVNGSPLPTRIKLGLDLGLDDKHLPCNICQGLTPFNPAAQRKPGVFRWAPFLADQPGATVRFLNDCNAVQYEREAVIDLVFYREADEKTLARQIRVPPHGAATIRLGSDADLKDFFGGRVGWVTATSDNVNILSYYFVEHASGLVGGDHGF